jgi:hypothetical protein
MANQETQVMDQIIDTTRRKLFAFGAVSLAGLAVASTMRSTAVQAAAYSDLDILNFALNLEYLEANFYYLSAFGCTIDKPNAAAVAAGAPSAGIPITGPVGTAGTVVTTGAGKVPFTTIQAGSYATETAIEEGKHVLALQSAIGATSYVAQPAINLAVGAGQAWTTLATAALGAGTGAVYSPYANDNFFLIGAYVFEDVGVTAYHGAASLLTGTTTTLPAAAGILAVEAYHAGLIRTSITAADPTGSLGLIGITTSISALRSTLAQNALNGTPGGTFDGGTSATTSGPDDYGLATFSTPSGIGGGSAGVTATRIVDADVTNVIAYSRNTTQVLNIVTGGGKVTGTAPNATVNATATGVFFPAGMNAGPNGFK